MFQFANCECLPEGTSQKFTLGQPPSETLEILRPGYENWPKDPSNGNFHRESLNGKNVEFEVPEFQRNSAIEWFFLPSPHFDCHIAG